MHLAADIYMELSPVLYYGLGSASREPQTLSEPCLSGETWVNKALFPTPSPHVVKIHPLPSCSVRTRSVTRLVVVLTQILGVHQQLSAWYIIPVHLTSIRTSPTA